MNTNLLINILKEWVKFFLRIGIFSLFAVSLILTPIIICGPTDETWAAIYSVLSVSLFAFATYYLIHIKYKREVRVSLEMMCEPFSKTKYKLMLALILYSKQPSIKKLEAIKAKYSSDSIDIMVKFIDESYLESATSDVVKLNNLSKVAIVDDLFKLALDESVISEDEWTLLQTIMTMIKLPDATKELYNNKYSPYRAIFVNPFEKQKTTEIECAYQVQPDAYNTLPENKLTLPNKKESNISRMKKRAGRRKYHR